jgi:hypothetical protein
MKPMPLFVRPSTKYIEQHGVHPVGLFVDLLARESCGIGESLRHVLAFQIRVPSGPEGRLAVSPK